MRMIAAAGDRPTYWVPSGKSLCLGYWDALSRVLVAERYQEGGASSGVAFPAALGRRTLWRGQEVETYERLPVPGASGNSTTIYRCVYLIV